MRLHPLLIFLITATGLRFITFFPSVINHDESTYLVIADGMLKGGIYFVDLIDFKPIGIFLVCGLEQLILGRSIFLFRLFGAVIIALTAFMLFITKREAGYSRKAGMAAGMIYIFMISVFTYYGISLNTEHFFNFFVILGLYLFLKNKPLAFFLAGISMGLGFVIKYVVLSGFLAFSLFYLVTVMKEKGRILPAFLNLFYAGLGLILPFILLNLYYYQIGHYDEFIYMSFVAPSRYAASRSGWNMFIFFLDFQLRYFPVFVFFYYSLFRRPVKGTARINETLLVVLWIVFDAAIINYSGKRFGHYLIQLMLPVSFMAASFFEPSWLLPAWLEKVRSGLPGRVLLILAAMIILFTQYLDYKRKPDTPREIAEYLKPRLKAEDNIYTGNYHHILYYLLDRQSPTGFVHKGLIDNPQYADALGIDKEAEYRKIRESNPRFITYYKEDVNPLMEEFIDRHYTLVKEFYDDKYTIWLFGRTE